MSQDAVVHNLLELLPGEGGWNRIVDAPEIEQVVGEERKPAFGS